MRIENLELMIVMRKIVLTLIAVLTLLTGCIDKGKQVPFEEVNMDTVVRDTMVYGFCARGSDRDVLIIITDAGDTLSLNVTNARQDSLVKGNYAVGDELAVTVSADTTEAMMVVNKSALHGNWVMPNPIDGSSKMGLSILKGGTAESIDQSEVIYKSWRLFNGKLVLVLTREDGIGNDETQMFTIKRLTRDSLIIADDDDLYEYGRKELDVEENFDIELDDGMDEFFL